MGNLKPQLCKSVPGPHVTEAGKAVAGPGSSLWPHIYRGRANDSPVQRGSITVTGTQLKEHSKKKKQRSRETYMSS